VKFLPPAGFGSSFASGLGSAPPGAGVPPAFPPSGILNRRVMFEFLLNYKRDKYRLYNCMKKIVIFKANGQDFFISYYDNE
jgi:hypothetical protein